MSIASTVQMNIRLDRQLKQEGDRILAALGYSPSQAVRAMWEFIVDNRDQPGKITRFVEGSKGEAVDPTIQAKLDALKRGRTLCASLGHLDPQIANLPYKSLRDIAYEDKYNESL